MAVSNIPHKLVPAPVIGVKNFLFIEEGQLNPQYRNIPCEQEFVDYVQYWAVPAKDAGIFTNLAFTPQQDDFGNAIAKPTYDSFQVLRVRDKISHYVWWLPVTIDQFTASCATCCGTAFTPIAIPTLPIISPCQAVCNAVNDLGQYYSIWAAEVLPAAHHYVANGGYNDGQFVPLTASSIGALLTAMNANWRYVGDDSPPAEITWTRDEYTIFGTVTSGGSEDDTICLVIQVVPD